MRDLTDDDLQGDDLVDDPAVKVHKAVTKDDSFIPSHRELLREQRRKLILLYKEAATPEELAEIAAALAENEEALSTVYSPYINTKIKKSSTATIQANFDPAHGLSKERVAGLKKAYLTTAPLGRIRMLPDAMERSGQVLDSLHWLSGPSQWLENTSHTLSAFPLLVPVAIGLSLLSSVCETAIAIDNYSKGGYQARTNLGSAIVKLGLRVASSALLIGALVAGVAIVSNPVLLVGLIATSYGVTLYQKAYEYKQARKHRKEQKRDFLEPAKKAYDAAKNDPTTSPTTLLELETQLKIEQAKYLTLKHEYDKKKRNLINLGFTTGGLGLVFAGIALASLAVITVAAPWVVPVALCVGALAMAGPTIKNIYDRYKNEIENQSKIKLHQLKARSEKLFEQLEIARKYINENDSTKENEHNALLNKLYALQKEIQALEETDIKKIDSTKLNQLTSQMNHLNKQINSFFKKELKTEAVYFDNEKMYSTAIRPDEVAEKLKTLKIPFTPQGRIENITPQNTPDYSLTMNVLQLEDSPRKWYEPRLQKNPIPVCSVQRTEQNKKISDIYFDPEKVKKASDDQFRRWAIAEVEKFHVQHITIFGNLPPKLVMAIADYCARQKYSYNIEASVDPSVQHYKPTSERIAAMNKFIAKTSDLPIPEKTAPASSSRQFTSFIPILGTRAVDKRERAEVMQNRSNNPVNRK